MNRLIFAAALCASSMLLGAPSALADGMPNASSAQNRSMVILTREKGVAVYRGPRALAGAPLPAPAEAAEGASRPTAKTAVVEHHYHSKIRHLRTQGFYAGHPGKSRRFTQGFYSGPVDKGRSTHRHCHHG